GEVGGGKVELSTSLGKEILYVRLLDSYLDVDVEVIPETERGVVLLRRSDVRAEVGCHLLRIGVEVFDVLGGSLIVLTADVERQIAALAAGVDEGLRQVDLVLVAYAVAFEDVCPAASADITVQSGADSQDLGEEGDALLPIGCLDGCTRTMRR